MSSKEWTIWKNNLFKLFYSKQNLLSRRRHFSIDDYLDKFKVDEIDLFILFLSKDFVKVLLLFSHLDSRKQISLHEMSRMFDDNPQALYCSVDTHE